MKIFISVLLGVLFGTILIASDAFQWVRIQEMFHFESFHMFGLIFSAIGTAAIAIWILKRSKCKSVFGNPIQLKRKENNLKANVFGGLFFGAGWSLTGACTAPIFILTGVHWKIGLIILTGVILGVIIFAVTKSKLPGA